MQEQGSGCSGSSSSPVFTRHRSSFFVTGLKDIFFGCGLPAQSAGERSTWAELGEVADMDIQYIVLCPMTYIYNITNSTAQGRGGSFKNRKPIGEVVVVNHGWQSESTDGQKGGWSCAFWSGCNVCSGHLTTTAGCSLV